MGKVKWSQLTGFGINEVKTSSTNSKGTEYCFELAGISNYQSSNYGGPTASGCLMQQNFHVGNIENSKQIAAEQQNRRFSSF